MTDRTELARRVLALVDLTNLSEQCADGDVDRLCERALGPHGTVAAVCVWPRFVRRAAHALAGSGVHVATVVNFPDGDSDQATVVAETRQAVADGADEIDLVLPYRAFLAGDAATAAAMVAAVRSAAALPVLLKVILEAGSYPDLASVRSATGLAIAEGADFVKTSTGTTDRSASPEIVEAILAEIGTNGSVVGVKPSGGIRTLDDASRYIEVADRMMGPHWATSATFRFGSSALVDAVGDELAG